MKKTISVNIKGVSFTIEEDAYELLQDYLDRLEKTLGNQDGSKEIIEDIEIRIAELFSERLSTSKTVVELADVEQILANLGKPEDFVEFDEEEESQNKKAYAESNPKGSEKRLFRDEENATIAGVCAGIANYFNMDVVIIRIIFVIILLFAGFGFPLYIILWIAIPKARNTIDRLRMKGRPITVENVKTEVEYAAEKVKDSSRRFAKKVDSSDYKRRISRGARIVSSIIGIGLIALGLTQLIAFLLVIIGGSQIIPVQSDAGFLSVTELGELLLSNPADVKWAWIGGLMVSLSMILFLFLLGSILLFHLRNRWGKLSLLGLFITGIVGVLICISVGMRTTRDIAIDAEIERLVGTVATNELVVLPQLQQLSDDQSYNIKSNGQFGLMTIDGDLIKEHGIEFEYIQSTDSMFHIYQNLSARSHTSTRAIAKSENIQHGITLLGDSLLVDTDYAFPKKDKLRDQDVVIIIEIPKGGQVKFKDQIIYLPEFSEQSGSEYRYYKESGYLRGDGRYRHHSTHRDWTERLDEIEDEVEDLGEEIGAEIEETFDNL